MLQINVSCQKRALSSYIFRNKFENLFVMMTNGFFYRKMWRDWNHLKLDKTNIFQRQTKFLEIQFFFIVIRIYFSSHWFDALIKKNYQRVAYFLKYCQQNIKLMTWDKISAHQNQNIQNNINGKTNRDEKKCEIVGASNINEEFIQDSISIYAKSVMAYVGISVLMDFRVKCENNQTKDTKQTSFFVWLMSSKSYSIWRVVCQKLSIQRFA